MKKIFTLSLCLLCFFIGTNSIAGDLFDGNNNTNSYFTPSKRTQLTAMYFGPLVQTQQDTTILTREQQLAFLPGYKLPKKALLFSTLIPGAGELYVKSYWRAAAFFLVEVGAWAFYANYRKKGKEQEDVFEAYADLNWDPEKWKIWYETDGASLIDQTNEDNFTHASHMLELISENRKTQQYYEMIGKYAEFVSGWDGVDPNEIFIDWNWTELENYRYTQCQIADDYMNMRAESNDLFRTARNVTNFIIINHILSAIDATWAAKVSNNRLLKTSMRFEHIHYANRMQPVFSFKFNW